ncbi:hypothetical protein KDH_76050 [Dictyobacter sp. S3.2.2.5]|uniref:Uncharacterized protein n=1 Tax=Dictyobacter halimunensis TaxID=3026934 RepID=A0ABQ6G7J9_9CHLR|nr:hypothetical protein KDH_76050 [Dictyobacter sp. S3.2.2.5]
METPEGTVRTIGRYFEEGHWRSDTRPGPPGRVGSYHRTLSTYLNTLTASGLQLVRMSEPGPSLSDSNRPVWSEVPSILIVSSRKPSEHF